MTQLGPIAELALGIGRLDARISSLIDLEAAPLLERTASGGLEPVQIDRWIVIAAGQYEWLYSKLRYVNAQVWTVGASCSVFNLHEYEYVYEYEYEYESMSSQKALQGCIHRCSSRCYPREQAEIWPNRNDNTGRVAIRIYSSEFT